MSPFTKHTDPMIWTVYSIVLLYFILGGIGFYVINRKKAKAVARKSYVKFTVYFLIINLLFVSIAFWPHSFRYLALSIVGGGLYEMIRVFNRSDKRFPVLFVTGLLGFSIVAIGFYQYSKMETGLMLYSFLVASIFDSFSQITGQLWGRRKILPRISPNKTWGGVVGGGVIALLSGLLLRNLYKMAVSDWLFLTAGIIVFAFAGDALASWYKRKYSVKDYSKLIPGHGGILDRFDSLITTGAFVYFYYLFL